MDRKHLLTAIIGTALLFSAVALSARSQTTSTPLYTLRMEQASSKMNFLPTTVNEFTYTAEKGYEYAYKVSGYCGELFDFTEIPCQITDESCVKTCRLTCSTCGSTCGYTCGYTCGCSCGFTCDTCVATCGNTCNPTCDAITCDSCINTCITCSSCSLTCSTC